MKKPVIIAIAVVLAVLVFYLGWSLFSVPSVSFVTLQLDEAVETLLISGRVVGEGSVPLSFKRPGQVVEVDVREGDQVQFGNLIAFLEDSDVKNLVTQSENNLSSAEIALSRLENRELPQAQEALSQAETRAEIAASIYNSAKEERLDPANARLVDADRNELTARRFFEDQIKLYEEGKIDLNALQSAENKWKQAFNEMELANTEKDKIALEVENLLREIEIALSQKRAAESALQSLRSEELNQAKLNVSQARTQLEKARLELDQTRLEAPFPGTIVRISVSPGQYVNIGQEVCVIIPIAANTYIEAQVDEALAGIVSVGQEVLVSSAAFPEKTLNGSVERVSPTVDPDRGTFQVRFVLERFEPDLLPDLAVSAEIVTNRIPNSLIIEQGLTFREDNRVFVLIEKGGKVVKREVVVEDLGRGLLRVTSGLASGERLLIDLEIEEGKRIRLGEEVKSD